MEDQTRIKEVLEQNAQLELEKQRTSVQGLLPNPSSFCYMIIYISVSSVPTSFSVSSAERETVLRAQLDRERSHAGASPSKFTVISPPRVTESDM